MFLFFSVTVLIGLFIETKALDLRPKVYEGQGKSMIGDIGFGKIPFSSMYISQISDYIK